MRRKPDIISIYKAAMGWCWHRSRGDKIISESHGFYVRKAACERIARELNPGCKFEIDDDDDR